MKSDLRVLWLAVADARGHLMRAQLLWHHLKSRGISLDVWTTSRAGVAFLDSFQVPSRLLSEHHRVEFDDAHNLDPVATDARTARYLLDPTKMLRDLSTLTREARGADLVVDDSFHPALLFAGMHPSARRLKIVHVYAEGLKPSLEQHFEGRLPKGLASWFGRAVGRVVGGAHGRIQHSVAWESFADGSGTYNLPPVMTPPSEEVSSVRRRLRVEGGRLGAVYLNPHFKDERIALAIEVAFKRHEISLYGVSEVFGARPHWRATDERLVDIVRAADVYVSGPGMGALNHVFLFGVPFFALVTQQPEQHHNVRLLSKSDATFHLHSLESPPNVQALTDQLGLLVRRPAVRRHDVSTHEVYDLWAETLRELSRPKSPSQGVTAC